MKKSVLLIGLGGIGFRHFQAILNCKEEFDLYVVDISNEAIKRAHDYAGSISYNASVHYYLSIDDIPSMHFNVAFIATASIQRRSIFENIIKKHLIDNVIFEKFLFPTFEDYEVVERVLNEKKIKAFVDCPARMYSFYHSIKAENKDCKYFIACMKGSNWGLACNAIHLIDQVAFMSDADTKNIDCIGILEDKIFESKRKGYIEFFGKLIGDIDKKCKFIIECDHMDNELSFEFVTDKAYYYINEVKGLFIKVDLINNNQITIDKIDVPYVSQLTNINIDCLLSGKKIDLPSYSESKPLHESLLKVFIAHMNKVSGKISKSCPIT